jgi:4-amino-4-deoxy-L-arabinose transferase-like glycosyltransferase
MASPTLAWPRRGPWAAARPLRRSVPWLASGVVAAGAVGLRLAALSRSPGDPYYDAAVRSMGVSWHNFLFGALEPGGKVAVDKPPVDLWLQVASTKLLGFGTSALLLPEALAGCAAVLALFVLLRRLWGVPEAIAGAAALAVLPVSVLTARSDTMDTFAVALALGAAVLLVRSARTGGRWSLVAAGVAIGLAFNVKVFQALIPVPALAVLYACASDLRLRDRLSRLALTGAVATAVALSWLAVVTAAPARVQPWAFGSTDGTAVNATFVYNGIDRLEGRPSAQRAQPADLVATRPDAPGPTRLAGTGGALDRRLAPELVPALIAAALALAAAALARRRRGSRPVATPRLARAGALGFGTWMLTGLLLFSFLKGLQVRYLEAFTPAVAATLGVSVVALARRLRGPVWAGVAVLAVLLAIPVQQSVAIVRAGASDSGHIGGMPPGEVAALSRYLLRHDRGARYELASATAVKAAALVVHDGRPVLVLDALARQPILPLPRLISAVRHREVRFMLMTAGCQTGCGAAVAWALQHGHDVTRQAGLPGRGVLYSLPASATRLP